MSTIAASKLSVLKPPPIASLFPKEFMNSVADHCIDQLQHQNHLDDSELCEEDAFLEVITSTSTTNQIYQLQHFERQGSEGQPADFQSAKENEGIEGLNNGGSALFLGGSLEESDFSAEYCDGLSQESVLALAAYLKAVTVDTWPSNNSYNDGSNNDSDIGMNKMDLPQDKGHERASADSDLLDTLLDRIDSPSTHAICPLNDGSSLHQVQSERKVVVDRGEMGITLLMMPNRPCSPSPSRSLAAVAERGHLLTATSIAQKGHTHPTSRPKVSSIYTTTATDREDAKGVNHFADQLLKGIQDSILESRYRKIGLNRSNKGYASLHQNYNIVQQFDNDSSTCSMKPEQAPGPGPGPRNKSPRHLLISKRMPSPPQSFLGSDPSDGFTHVAIKPSPPKISKNAS